MVGSDIFSLEENVSVKMQIEGDTIVSEASR